MAENRDTFAVRYEKTYISKLKQYNTLLYKIHIKCTGNYSVIYYFFHDYENVRNVVFFQSLY